MVKEIPLTQSKVAVVSDEDYNLVINHNWYAHYRPKVNNWYARTTINKKKIYMHRLILNVLNSLKPIDHLNGDGLDNRRTNIRICTTSENNRNARKIIANKSSKYKGVTFHKVIRKWQAQLSFNNKSIYLGVFDKEEDAAKAYNTMVQFLRGYSP